LTARRAPVRCLALVVTFLLALWSGSSAEAASDPYLEWWTIETPHFRIHYYKGLEPVAERLAELAEGVNARLSVALGWQMSEVTQIVITDNTDDANGSATSLPYNTIRLYATAPDDLSPLGDYDDWYLELITHEHTHILHTDNITGVPAVVNSIMGKWWSPNQAQPRWILEGLAVLEESEHTGGGRNRSAIFDMYLRSDVLDNRLIGLDQMSHFTRRWPQGNVWYLYGSRFLTWIADVYGDEALRSVAQDYGRQVIPWGINRSIRRATGQTYEELYTGWKAYLEDHYAEQMRQVEALGVREGVRLTHHGETVGSPRFVPPPAKKTRAERELLYFRSDGHTPGGFYRLPLRAGNMPVTSEDHMAIRSQGVGSASFAADGRVVWSSAAITSRIYAFDDLFTLPSGVEGPSGYEPERRRLTEGQRAKEPDVSADGTEVVFTEDHRGTRTLIIASLSPEGTLSDARALVPSARFEQAYTPRFSPDGKWVAYSVWTAGGYRDIRLVEVATGRFTEIAHDRAAEWDPSFSSDGKIVFFSSDRVLGIPNVFAFDRESNKLWQVTNVRTGALTPEVSPDDRTLVYVGYTSYGYDLFAMDVDRAKWTEPPEYVDTRPDAPSPVRGPITARHRYNPLPTLRPRSWNFDYTTPGALGNTYTLTTQGSDAVGHHGIAASLRFDTKRSDPQVAVSYGYGRLPFDFGISLFRQAVPMGSDYVEQQIGVTSGIGYVLPSEFETNSFSLNYSLYRFDGTIAAPVSADPQDPIPGRPSRGQIGAVTLGWAFSNAQAYLHSVGAERGFSLSVFTSVAALPLASDFTQYTFGYSATDYIPLPWAHHHSLALRASAAITMGNYPRRGVFGNGGFADTPLSTSLTQQIYQSPFVLRGYPVRAFSGDQYHLYNAEYRFPIVNIDRGFSTFPLFFQRVNGTFFADYGGAFYDLDPHNWTDQFHLGVGAELWIECTVAYFLNPLIRIGYAHGIDDAAATPGGQTYTVISIPF
jgi:hypothetical protein